MRLGFFLLVWCLGMGWKAQAQEKCLWIPSSQLQAGVLLDSLLALEKTIRVQDRDGKIYSFHYQSSNRIIPVHFSNESIPDSLQVCYRTLAIRPDQTFARRTLLQDYDSAAVFRDTRIIEAPALDIR